MLLKEIAYWTYYFLSKNKSYGKSADTRIDSALIVSVLLFVNILTIVYIAERDLCKTLPHSLSFLFLNTIGSPAVNIFGF